MLTHIITPDNVTISTSASNPEWMIGTVRWEGYPTGTSILTFLDEDLLNSNIYTLTITLSVQTSDPNAVFNIIVRNGGTELTNYILTQLSGISGPLSFNLNGQMFDNILFQSSDPHDYIILVNEIQYSLLPEGTNTGWYPGRIVRATPNIVGDIMPSGPLTYAWYSKLNGGQFTRIVGAESYNYQLKTSDHGRTIMCQIQFPYNDTTYTIYSQEILVSGTGSTTPDPTIVAIKWSRIYSESITFHYLSDTSIATLVHGSLHILTDIEGYAETELGIQWTATLIECTYGSGEHAYTPPGLLPILPTGTVYTYTHEQLLNNEGLLDVALIPQVFLIGGTFPVVYYNDQDWYNVNPYVVILTPTVNGVLFPELQIIYSDGGW